ncbi:MAG: PEP-CTERM sorting domain-containing protein [Methylacidiphilales bacterium]|nr:PEP-CTERM sorting domain-containing protein [Candidatus Methylacidiphilales bacterium]MDW8349003.1 PEP-CTERM sorting domain-containing protein [Verrucomicrobiae bacterium]
MKKIAILTLSVVTSLILANSTAVAQLTYQIGVTAGQFTFNSNPLPNNSLLVVVASLSNSTFGAPTPTSFTGEPDDVVLAKLSIGAGTNVTGAIVDLFTIDANNFPGLNGGDPLALYWYPTLTTSSLQPGAGTPYGTYSGPWTLPASPGIYTASDPGGILFVSQSLGGSFNNSLFTTNFVTIPEPSTYALIGIGLLIMGYVSRMRSALQNARK